MKTNLRALAGLPLAAFLVVAPFGAQALTTDLKSQTGASVGSNGVTTSVKGAVSVGGTTTQNSTNGSGQGSVSGAGSSSATVSHTNGSSPDTSSTDGDSTGNVSVTGTVSGSITPIAIDRADVDTETDVAVDTSVSSPERVRTQADLSAYANSAVRSDKNIDGVVLSDSGVMVRYMQPARLFGFIPVTVTVTTEVDSQGTVSVKYPWYRFLVAVGDKEELETAIQARVNGALKAHTTSTASNATSVTSEGSDSALTGSAFATTTVMLDAAVKAQLLAEVSEVMKTAADATLDVSTAASVDAR